MVREQTGSKNVSFFIFYQSTWLHSGLRQPSSLLGSLPLGSKWRFWQDHSQSMLRTQVTKCSSLDDSLAGLLLDILLSYLEWPSMWTHLATKYTSASSAMPLGAGVSIFIRLFAGTILSNPAQLFHGMTDSFLINYLVILTASLVIPILWNTLERHMKNLVCFPLTEDAAWATLMWLRWISLS